MNKPESLCSRLRDTSREPLRRKPLIEILPDIMSRAQNLVGADVAFMAIYDEKVEGMRVVYYIGTDRALPDNYIIRKGEGVSGKAWETGQLVVATDYLKYAHRLPEPYWASMKSVVAMPLWVNSKVWAVLIFTHTVVKKKMDFIELEMLKLFAKFASGTIENSQIQNQAATELMCFENSL